MTQLTKTAYVAAVLVLGAHLAAASPTRQSRLNLGQGAVLTIVSSGGSVSLHPGAEQQVIVNSTTHSERVEADVHATPDGKRGEVITHVLTAQGLSADEMRVDYEIFVPAGISVIISTATAPITVAGVSGDISISSDTGQIVVRQVSKSHLHVRGVASAITLSDVIGTHVDITSTTGPVQMSQVSGPMVEVRTASGRISYNGDFSEGGHYKLSTHDAPIDVFMPALASVDLTALSSNGAVDQPDLPFDKKEHTNVPPSPGRSFTGTSHSGSSSVELHSYSGRIRVKKQ
ncbi:MAG TPA: DUF4097 family beta strand repeat-containing protein [Candidatus Saccharimonadales bacterium]|jgi:hypothetical protein|nr:DUF4097 family beta strand repeat-containing protein [Candidatus Saccharimonadales bacterium]